MDLKTERFTVSCLCQSIDIIISTAMCQHCDTAHCNTHKVPLIQSVTLPDIPPLAACHSTQSALHNSNRYCKACYSRLILRLVIYGNQFHTPAALSAGPIQKNSMCVSAPFCKLRKKEKPIFLGGYPTACILVIIMTEPTRLPSEPRNWLI